MMVSMSRAGVAAFLWMAPLSAQVDPPAQEGLGLGLPPAILVERILAGEDGSGSWDALIQALGRPVTSGIATPVGSPATRGAEASGVRQALGAAASTLGRYPFAVAASVAALPLLLLALGRLGRGRPSRPRRAGRARTPIRRGLVRRARADPASWSQDAARLQARLRSRSAA